MPSARRNRFAHAWRMTGARQARRAHGDGSGRGREALCPAEQMRGEGGSPSARAAPRIGSEAEFSPADDPGTSRIPPFRHHCLSRARSLDGYKGAVARWSAFEGFRGFMPDPGGGSFHPSRRIREGLGGIRPACGTLGSGRERVDRAYAACAEARGRPVLTGAFAGGFGRADFPR